MTWLYSLLAVYALGGLLTSWLVLYMPWELSLMDRLMVFVAWPVILWGLAR